MCRVIAVSNQKGGVGKTVSCVNLGIGLAQEGKKVLMIDADPQGSLTISLGYEEPDEMEYSLATLMMNIVNDEKLNIEKTILHHKEGVDLIPANIELSAIEVSLVNAMSRELILRSMVDRLREFYDYIIIDCMPSLGMMTINALACADSVLIPVQAAYLPVKGLQQLIKTIGRVKKQLNPKLKIEGILLTMVDNRTNYARDISLMGMTPILHQLRYLKQRKRSSLCCSCASRFSTCSFSARSCSRLFCFAILVDLLF